MSDSLFQSADIARLNPHSFAARALEAKQRQDVQSSNSLRAAGLTAAFFPAAEAGKVPEALEALGSSIREGRTFSQALSALPSGQRLEIQKRLGSFLPEMEALAGTADEASFWSGAVQLGIRLKGADRLEAAAGLLSLLNQDQVPAASRAQAKAEFDAIAGKGSWALRTEFLVGNLAKQASDYRTIVPMLGASVLGQTVSATVLGRLAGAPATGLARTLGTRILAGTAGFAVEVPIFAAASRALGDGPAAPFSDDLLRSALSLGALRAFGYLGNQAFAKLHGVSEIGVATRLTGLSRFTQAALPQATMFAGMYAAHRVEEALKLRPRVDGATTVTDILGSMVSLQVGSHLGQKLVGPGLNRFSQEMLLRVEAKENGGLALFFPPAEGSRALAAEGPALPAKASAPQELPFVSMMSSLENGGRSGNGGNGRSGNATPESAPATQEQNKAQADSALALYRAYQSGDLAAKDRLAQSDLAPLVELAAQGDPAGVFALRYINAAGHPGVDKVLKKIDVRALTEGAKLDPKIFEHLAKINTYHMEKEQKLSEDYQAAKESAGQESDSAKAQLELATAKEKYQEGRNQLTEEINTLYDEARSQPAYKAADRCEEALRNLEQNKNSDAKYALIEVMLYRDILQARLDPIQGVPTLETWAENARPPILVFDVIFDSILGGNSKPPAGKKRIRNLAEEELKTFNVKDLSYEARQNEDPKAVNALVILAEFGNTEALSVLKQLGMRDDAIKKQVANVPDNALFRQKGLIGYYWHALRNLFSSKEK